ncbi:MAG: hypothetical protein AYK18_09080 [Theionarchaea archaeon DG-70]|nr:MAG: hypothetical protein AYK18_09080 [Theionarchaea archaeon DG-70]
MLNNVMKIYELLEQPHVKGKEVAALFTKAEVETITEEGSTDFITIEFGSKSPTLGIIGQLGGIGAQERIGLVSDAEGALTALSCALELEKLSLKGRIIVTTHICPAAPIIPHELVDFMGAPLSVSTMMEHLVDERMDAILSVDTTRGNRIINHKGIAISPTVKEGYILRVSEDLLDIQQQVTGQLPVVFPITTQDITPYSNNVYHLNAIMQPCTKTDAPVVGVGITSQVVVPGCATGASQLLDVEAAARFCIEVAKEYTEGVCTFYDEQEFQTMKRLYGSMTQLQH